MPGDKTLTYYYDATGRKLSQVLATSSTVTKKTDYANEYIYENDTLQFINTSEGPYVANAGAVTVGIRSLLQIRKKDWVHLLHSDTEFFGVVGSELQNSGQREGVYGMIQIPRTND